MNRTTLWFIIIIVILFIIVPLGFSRSLEEIKSDKRLIVLVMDEVTPPIYYLDDKDMPTGIDIDLAEIR